MRSHVALCLLVAPTWILSAQATPERELRLAVGPFPHIAGSELGKSIDFENEIDIHRCFALLMKGEVVAWIHRAHAIPTRVLVQRCVEYDPAFDQTPGNRHGGVKQSWDRVVDRPGRQELEFVAIT